MTARVPLINEPDPVSAEAHWMSCFQYCLLVVLILLLRRDRDASPTTSRDILSTGRLAMLVCRSCPPDDAAALS